MSEAFSIATKQNIFYQTLFIIRIILFKSNPTFIYTPDFLSSLIIADFEKKYLNFRKLYKLWILESLVALQRAHSNPLLPPSDEM